MNECLTIFLNVCLSINCNVRPCQNLSVIPCLFILMSVCNASELDGLCLTCDSIWSNIFHATYHAETQQCQISLYDIHYMQRRLHIPAPFYASKVSIFFSTFIVDNHQLILHHTIWHIHCNRLNVYNISPQLTFIFPDVDGNYPLLSQDGISLCAI